MNKPTARQAARIEQGIREHQQLLDKELRYSADLQKPAYVASLNASIARLQNMLATGAGLPVFAA